MYKRMCVGKHGLYPWPAALLAALVAGGIGGCATAPPPAPHACTIDPAPPVQLLSLQDAMRQVTAIPNLCPSRATVISDPGCWRPTRVNIDNATLSFWFADHGNAVFQLPLTRLPTLARAHLGCHPYVTIGNDKFFTTNNDDARFYESVLTQLPMRVGEQAWRTQRFLSIIAGAYASMAVKPVPGEEVRKYWVQAKDAIRRKQFPDAANLLQKANTVAPWWPNAPYELAYINEQLGHYRSAATWMKYYLMLVPNASDARALRDKAYVWEGRATSPAPVKPVQEPYSELPPHSLGVSLADRSESTAFVFEANHVPSGGALVMDVAAGSPAQTAGLLPGDIITGIDAQPAKSAQDVVKAIHTTVPGADIAIKLVRNGEQQTLVARH